MLLALVDRPARVGDRRGTGDRAGRDTVGAWLGRRWRCAACGWARSFVVLEDVDLAVAGGEIVAVTGVNGAGKSTLLSCLAGLHRPRPAR